MNLVYRIQRRLKVNRAIRELSLLDDTILLDIGVERGNIAEIVKKSIGSKNGRIVKAEPVVSGNVSDNYHVPGGAAA